MTIQELTNEYPDVVRIFLVRHGQTDHNKNMIMQGHLDVPLNEEGFKQAELVGKRFVGVPIDTFVSSDLTRCMQTISKIVQHHGIDAFENTDQEKFRKTPELRERNMGPVEGMKLTEAVSKYGKDFRNLGEKRHELVTRLMNEWNNIAAEATTKDYKNVLVCTHGGVIGNFINYLYNDMNYKLNPKLKEEDLKVPFNTSLTIVDINKKDRTLNTIQMFGDTKHLGEQLDVKDQRLR